MWADSYGGRVNRTLVCGRKGTGNDNETHVIDLKQKCFKSDGTVLLYHSLKNMIKNTLNSILIISKYRF